MMDQLFLSVLNLSITGSFVIAIVIFARLLLKKVPKVFAYVLWSVVLFRLLCPFSFESAIGLLPTKPEPIPQDIVYQAVPEINSGIDIVDHTINPLLPPVTQPEASVNPIQIQIFIGRTIWLIGIMVMLACSISSFVRLKKKLVGSTSLNDNIYIADHIVSPFVLGVFQPKIYLPSSLSEGEMDYIIAHEKYHIKRLDHVIRVLAFIALALHWFNPLVWLAFILSGKDMEMSCDESVMKNMSKDIRAKYCASLMRIATGKKMKFVTPLAFGEGNPKERVKNVMKFKKPMVWALVMAMIVVIFVVVGFATNQKSEDQDLSLLNPVDISPKEDNTPIDTSEPSQSDSWGITLTATEVTPTGLTLVYTQSGGSVTGELWTDTKYYLSKNNNGIWNDIAYLPDITVAWKDLALVVGKDSTAQWEIEYHWIYGELSEGEYKIRKDFYNLDDNGERATRSYEAVFEVTITPEPEESSGEKEDNLTSNLLAYFNETYFNGATGENLNLANQFLHNSFDSPSNIDLYSLFYLGAGADYAMNESGEYDAVAKAYGLDSWNEIPTDVTAIPAASMDNLLEQYMGIDVSASNKNGLDSFKYLEEYNCYYNLHGDTNYFGNVQFVSGTQKGDRIYLNYYNRLQDEDYVLCLVDYGNKNYKIFSNLPATTE